MYGKVVNQIENVFSIMKNSAGVFKNLIPNGKFSHFVDSDGITKTRQEVKPVDCLKFQTVKSRGKSALYIPLLQLDDAIDLLDSYAENGIDWYPDEKPVTYFIEQSITKTPDPKNPGKYIVSFRFLPGKGQGSVEISADEFKEFVDTLREMRASPVVDNAINYLKNSNK